MAKNGSLWTVLILINRVTALQRSRFFLDTGNALYLVTARHVMFGDISGEFDKSKPLLCKEARLLSYSKDPQEKRQNVINLDLELLNKNGNVKVHKTHDVAIVYMGNAKREDETVITELVKGIIPISTTDSGILTTKIEFIKKFDQVLTANEVYVFGYPNSIGLEGYPQIDSKKPLLRKGIVAGTNDL